MNPIWAVSFMNEVFLLLFKTYSNCTHMGKNIITLTPTIYLLSENAGFIFNSLMYIWFFKITWRFITVQARLQEKKMAWKSWKSKRKKNRFLINFINLGTLYLENDKYLSKLEALLRK